jgi:hypothetical protein
MIWWQYEKRRTLIQKSQVLHPMLDQTLTNDQNYLTSFPDHSGEMWLVTVFLTEATKQRFGTSKLQYDYPIGE